MAMPETITQREDLADGGKGGREGVTGGGTGKRTNRTVQIPLTGAPWVLLQVPCPMTEANWDEMKKQLDLLKARLTTPPTDQ